MSKSILFFIGLFSMLSSFAQVNCNVQWDHVYHDTFNNKFRYPTGPVTQKTEMTIKIQTAKDDLTSVRLRLWDDYLKKENYLEMKKIQSDRDEFDLWETKFNTGPNQTILFYFFELNDYGNGSCKPDTDYYVDDNPIFYGGGTGYMVENIDYFKSFQITVYDRNFKTPDWLKQGVIYQIFVDRFRDGNPNNNPSPGRFYYKSFDGTIFRSKSEKWNSKICDPRWTYSPHCLHQYGENFYGGDLRGIIQKLDEGYFERLGVNTLYLNPIFKSPSNHKYDTSNFFDIDPDFGTMNDLQELLEKLRKRNMKIILDGVFNHTSSDSKYFDYYSRYEHSGACESEESIFRNWFFFPAFGNPAISSVPITCAGGLTYEAWFGYETLPKLNGKNPHVREYFWANGINSVAPYWINLGIDGWRLDVAGDIDPGHTKDPLNDYWEGFRLAVKNISSKKEVAIIGEEWGDASPWLLGNEWDSVMNYRLRSALLGWLFTGCIGNGCKSNGNVFEDNDSNSQNYSGSIHYLSPSALNSRLLSMWEDYPPEAFKAMMNLTGSHDTNRMRFLLKKINFNNDEAAIQRMKEWWLFLFTYPGTPTIYYGDEIGLTQDGVFANGKYEDDPYNRIPYPWDDTPGYYQGRKDLLESLQKLSKIRNSNRVLQDGDIKHGLVIDDEKKLYGFSRHLEDDLALIVLNRSNFAKSIQLDNLDQYNEMTFRDTLNGNKSYTVKNGSIKFNVNDNWGAILILSNRKK